MTSVVGHPFESQVFYFGHCSGGVWKTVDGGRFWENISDGFFRTAAVGALAIASADPNVLYAGMGESTIRGNVSHGDGVYRSTDGGRSWRHVGLAATRHIAKVRVHPTDPNLVYVAALGHAYGPNPERGIFRSRDGGESWEHILFRTERAGAVDLSLDPTNPRIMYAAFWEGGRSPWSLSSGGPGSGLFRSTDGGDTWTELNSRPGLPRSLWGKPGIVVSPANPDRVWALVEAVDGGLFRSEDRAETWVRITEERRIWQRSWYFMHLFADPRDAETVWALNVQAWRSTDGGGHFQAFPTPFEDQHDLWIDPSNPNRLIEGNDGGACVSFNGGATWSSQYNQPTAQFYHVATDNQLPYRLYGAQQDINTLSVPSRSDNAAISAADWYTVGGGESGHVAVRVDDPNIVYAGSFGGHLTRYDHRTGQVQDVSVWPDDPMGWAAGDLKYRFQWTFPVVTSVHDADVVYVTSQDVHRSRDGGMSWETISGDLTRADPATLGPSGGPITKDNVSTEYYATVFAFAESPLDGSILWAGSDDGLVHVTRDAGVNWQPVTPPDLPRRALISTIEPSQHDAATAYVAATCYKSDDFGPYLYATTDFGATWRKMTTGIPEDDFTRVIREDPSRSGLLYAGTETGVYVSWDSGAHWHPFQGNLPVVPIHDLAVKNGDLVAATHGRSLWIRDDITPLTEWTDQTKRESARLFAPRPAVRFRTLHGFSLPRADGRNTRLIGPLHISYRYDQDREILLDAGANPPFGAAISFSLGQAASSVIVSILDASGTLIRDLPDVPSSAGLHRVTWDLRYPEPTSVPGATFWESDSGGPLAPPGMYQVELAVDGAVHRQPLQVQVDPRVAATNEDLAAQFELLLRIRDKLSDAHGAINQITTVREQIAVWRTRLAARAEFTEPLADLEQLDTRLAAIEGELIQRAPGLTYSNPVRLNAKLAALSAMVGSADVRPTRQAYEVFAELAAQVNQQRTQLEEVLHDRLPALNERLSRRGLGALAAW
ncbi:MAG: glycosyl hydrolase [Chloroflexota bacterium]|nr:glycosyl hydrolase [Chloroflexota bacterium]